MNARRQYAYLGIAYRPGPQQPYGSAIVSAINFNGRQTARYARRQWRRELSGCTVRIYRMPLTVYGNRNRANRWDAPTFIHCAEIYWSTEGRNAVSMWVSK